MSAQMDNVERIAERLQKIPWVTHVGTTDRDNATHQIETDLSVVRRAHEIHTLENYRGVTHEATSTLAPNARLYVTIS